jgi:O-acetyl-ADP-ribose deacetylase (regulator of RNase III)
MSHRVAIVRDGITTLPVDAIVNAANKPLLGDEHQRAGVCFRIHSLTLAATGTSWSPADRAPALR